MKSKDLVGQRFGRLVVIEKTRHNGRLAWKCQCDCGNTSVVSSYCLNHGTISCGCYRQEKWQEAQDKISEQANAKKLTDIIGKKFGKLTVLSYDELVGKYSCRCECDNIVYRARNTLLYGNSNVHSCNKCTLDTLIDGNVIGNRYGNLTVIGRDINTHMWLCKCDCGNTRLVKSGHLERTKSCGCNNIAISGSYAENEIKEFINIDNVVKSRTILGNGQEIDLYYPDYNIGIEFNGSIYHSSLNGIYDIKKKHYHRDKFLLAKAKGIHLISIFDVDWDKNSDKIKIYLNSLFSKNIKVYARNCNIQLIDKSIANEFCNKYHLQGSTIFSSICYGLYFGSELVSVMTFGKLRMSSTNDGEYELHRYCVKDNITVVGGANKLLKHFILDYKPTYIRSYSDNDYFSGSIYERLGFKNSGQCNPRYYWYCNNIEYKREECRISKLKNKYPDLYNSAISNKATNIEDYIMTSLKACKVYRSGNTKWELSL